MSARLGTVAAFALLFGALPAFGVTVIPAEVTRVRDPFKKPVIKKVAEKPRSDLEMWAVDKFKLMGIVTGPRNLRAMLLAPNGKSYFVAEGMSIGQHKGVIRKILSTGILVRERIVNVLGQEENVDTQLALPEEAKSVAGGPGGGAPAPSEGGMQ